MNACDIVGWTNGTGCLFCTECEPDDCDEKAPVFLDQMSDCSVSCCDECQCFIIDRGEP